MIDSIEASVGIYLATLIISVLSGLVPLVNGEVYLAAAILVVREPAAALALAVIVALGARRHRARPLDAAGRQARAGARAGRALAGQAAHRAVRLGGHRAAAVLPREPPGRRASVSGRMGALHARRLTSVKRPVR